MNIFLETERLVLKKPTEADYAAILELVTDLDVMKFIGDGSPFTPEATAAKLQRDILHHARHQFGFNMVYEKKSGDLIGQAGLFHLEYNDSQPDVEIGYRLHKAFWRQGYATELVRGIMQWGFANLSLDRLVAVIDPRNLNSQAVAKKAGMEFVKEFWCYDKNITLFEMTRLKYEAGKV
jgi:ribosomal-protein-alanine N-acetyltransferase